MKYITPEYKLDAIDTEDIMSASVIQTENETNSSISFDDLMNSLKDLTNN
ncbi:MAG: hypothetical protein IJ400_06650 [Clostridia bacterium]|nr:hypothetical protein [Clostridia bacterium]